MRLWRWFKKETLHIFPIFLFFLVCFTLINWIESFLFARMGVTPFGFFEVFVAAALIAKIVLVVDHLKVIHLFKKQPLIYGIFWKSGLYWIILLIIRLALRFIPFFLGNETHIEQDYDRFVSQVNWNIFISVQAYYLMLLFIFVTFQELAVKIGPKKMRQLFFGK